MKVLVTGGSSLPGYRLSRSLLDKGYSVIALHNKNAIPLEHSNLKKFSVDVRDMESFSKYFSKFEPDVVVHMAAYGDVDGCEKNMAYAWDVNVLGSRNVLKLAKKFSNYFVYLSTDYVFDGIRGSYREMDPPNPVNYYGLTKLAGELLFLSSGISGCIVRASSIFGAGPGRPNFAKFLVNRLEADNEVRALIDQYTTPTEASLLAEAICEIIENRYEGIFHVVSERVSRYDFAIRLTEIFGFDKNLIKPATMDEFKWYAPRPKDSSLDCSKTREVIKSDFHSLTKALNIFKDEYEGGL